MTERTTLIGLSLSFASFLMDSRVGEKINRIILFGSVARGDFDSSSDIDIFIDTDTDIEKEVNNQLLLFMSSQACKTWALKGVKNEISVKVGDLKKWSLRRDVISSGIILYGKYNEMPDNARYYLMVRMDMKKFSSAKQMSIWRHLYGYEQKIGNKVYVKKGLIETLGGKKLGKALVIVPMEKRRELTSYLNKNKVNYTQNELWSDSL